MPRECASCYFTGNKRDYSANQWRKGDGYSLCSGCVTKRTGGGGGGGGGGGEVAYYDSSSDDGYYNEATFDCLVCGQEFPEDNYAHTRDPTRVAREARDKHEEDAHGAPERLKFYHGTTWARAQRIQQDGWIPSDTGCLGRGIYVAREDKARKFAENTARHGSATGGLITVIVTFRNAKYVRSNDTSWRHEGHDACRADSTSASTNMEWCFKEDRQVTVVGLEKIDLRRTNCPICQTKQFASIGHAVQHVESGSCSGCLGADSARQQIYQFAQTNQQLLGDRRPVMQLDQYGGQIVPDKPYPCGCGKAFAQLSSMLEHQRVTGH